MNRHTITILLIIAISVTSFLYSYLENNWEIFARAGSLIVVLAVLLEYWPKIIQPDPGKMPMWTSIESHKSVRVSTISICFGTIIWGFGDLACHMFNQCPLK